MATNEMEKQSNDVKKESNDRKRNDMTMEGRHGGRVCVGVSECARVRVYVCIRKCVYVMHVCILGCMEE